MMKSTDLVRFCESKLGTNYIFGMKGHVMTLDRFNMLRRMHGDAVLLSDRNKIGTVCVDCSGLIEWATRELMGAANAVRLSSSGLRSNAKEAHPISTIANAPPGAILWRQGHVGVYVGNGECIEAKGSRDNTVRTRVSAGRWTLWLLMSYIDYSASSTPQSAPQQSAPPQGNQYRVHNCSSLNVRSGPGTSFRSVRTIRRDDIVTVFETQNGWGRHDRGGWSSMAFLQSVGNAKTPQTAATPPTRAFQVGDNVRVSGTLHSNSNGGNSVRHTGNMTIIRIVPTGRFPYQFAKRGKQIGFGFGDTSVIIS